ncbi:hypothetical protein FIV42_26095 [Persicimonas caeni]|uniref:DUF1801 domain-containing protein n=1 Tax=Persicimonas caeni TaxID=2292766 RepID=A0A4Y6Q0I4_PERCE|nr:hypothetical protein [Persicimonas caeni]QDG54086.1 hypothetical protein FIV42_26095 [Persicimonas caeni]QED35307.1 hypothetical protein FRD00_26090 [Persicimonas caeni]
MPKDFDAVFAELRPLVARYADEGVVKSDEADDYTLLGPEPDEKGRDVWVGSVQIKKNYVSFHLMPVYRFPELLDDISPALEKRMQGKSCFNFKEVDEELFAELDGLVERCVDKYRAEGLF